jgi:hypothetical protein
VRSLHRPEGVVIDSAPSAEIQSFRKICRGSRDSMERSGSFGGRFRRAGGFESESMKKPLRWEGEGDGPPYVEASRPTEAES